MRAYFKAIFCLLWLSLRYLWALLKLKTKSKKKKTCAVYYGGDIIVPDLMENVESLVVVSDQIAFMGKKDDAETFSHAHHDENVKWINLNGRTLSPAFIDPHLHPSMAAVLLSTHFITPFDWTFPWTGGSVKGVRTAQLYREAISNLVHKTTKDEWIITWGYHPLFHGEISREILDQLCPEKPLVVWHRSFHELHLNTKALMSCGVSKEKCDVDPQVDWNEGRFYEKGMETLLSGKQLLLRLIPNLELGYDRVCRVIERGGITTVADLEFPMFNEWLENVFAVLMLASEKRQFFTLAVPSSRLFGQKFNKNHHDAVRHIKKKAAQWQALNCNFCLSGNHVKIIGDGAFFSLNMQMIEPFNDGSRGHWMTPPDEIASVMSYYWKEEFQIHVHTNGDLAMKVVLDNVQRLQKEHPRVNHRTTIEHAGYFTESQADLLAQLGCLVSGQPFYFYALADKYSGHGLGREKAAKISPFRWLTDRKVPTALHSDFTMAPAQPLLQMWVAINRMTVNGNQGDVKQLGLSVKDAFDAVTIQAANILGKDHEIGTIEVGKLANFTILSKNPLKVPPMAIKDIQVHGTVYRGRLRYFTKDTSSSISKI